MPFPETKIIEQVEVPVLLLATTEAPEHLVLMAHPLLQEVVGHIIEAPEATNPEVLRRAEVTIVLLPVQALEAIEVVALREAVDPAGATAVPGAAQEVPV